MVIEVAKSVKDPEKEEKEFELPPQLTIQESDDPPRKRKQKKTCIVLLFLLIVGLVALCLFFGFKGYEYKKQYMSLVRKSPLLLSKMHHYQKYKSFKMDLVTDPRWKQLANTIATDCVHGLEEFELDIERNGHEEIKSESLYTLDSECLKKKIKMLNSARRG